ncbi:MarR family winged helix-turn-helix transcriptional regulator [Enterovibrio norvegicus]|uniref:MarR family winged helix-turn-helix transcriptional regulator n=1 Tax=Enterovibrio norvegicus TaxID=188144 RepID=UPI000C818ACB|nr:MarR family transcriptional regulator [Enterovibrio norvegicus]PMH62799.1 MarR family transcriptional regulator [Enterovibrio norvegicus]
MGVSQPFLLDDFLPYKLVKTASHVADALSRIYEKEFGITRPEWRILASLGARDGIKAKALAVETSLDKVKVSRTLVGLEKRELVCKTRDERDQRAAYLHLTEKGRALYDKVVPRAKEWEKELLAELSPEHYQTFLAMLDSLSAKTQKGEERVIREP